MDRYSVTWYARDGRPISMEEWGRLRRDPEYHRVAVDDVGVYHVSTVWLGLDHGFLPGGAPVIFETMVFAGGDDDRLGWDLFCQRYTTEQAAREGHEEVVTLIRATSVDDPRSPEGGVG